MTDITDPELNDNEQNEQLREYRPGDSDEGPEEQVYPGDTLVDVILAPNDQIRQFNISDIPDEELTESGRMFKAAFPGANVIEVAPEPNHFEGKHFYTGDQLILYVITPGARSLPQDHVDLALDQWSKGEWGDMDAEDKRSNNQSFKNKSGLMMGVYYSPPKGQSIVKPTEFWIHGYGRLDQGPVTVLLPAEY